MSDPRLHVVGPSDGEDEPQGCLESVQSMGLAMYAFLILGMLGASLACAGVSMWGMVAGAQGAKDLRGGAELELWRLAPLQQQWGVLTPEERPVLYHDHSLRADGTSGCAVVDQDLVRWDQRALTARVGIPGAEVRADGEADAPTVVVTQAGVEVACPFGRGQGGDRFLRMLQSEAARSP